MLARRGNQRANFLPSSGPLLAPSLVQAGVAQRSGAFFRASNALPRLSALARLSVFNDDCWRRWARARPLREVNLSLLVKVSGITIEWRREVFFASNGKGRGSLPA